MKTVKCITLFFLITSSLFSQTPKTMEDVMITPEGIGKHLYELLIGRASLKESPAMLDLSKIYNEENKSEYEDSPAMFIIASLFGSQIISLDSWDKLLYSADSLELNNTKYLKTIYLNTRPDQYQSVIVFTTPDNTYGAFYFNTIKWTGDQHYLLRITDRLVIGNSIDEVTSRCFDNADRDKTKEENFSLNKVKYPYKATKIPPLENTYLPSLKEISDSLLDALRKSKSFTELDFFTKKEDIEIITNDYRLLNNVQNDSTILSPVEVFDSMHKNWDKILKEIKDKCDTDNIERKTPIIGNFLFDNRNIAFLEFHFTCDDKQYVFSTIVILMDGEWKLASFYPLKERTKFDF